MVVVSGILNSSHKSMDTPPKMTDTSTRFNNSFVRGHFQQEEDEEKKGDF